MMKKSIAVLGLGKYGRSLAENLYLMGADVLAVDSDEKVVNDFSGKCTSVVQANMENEEEVAALGLKNMDIVVSCTGTNIAAAIMSVAVAKEQGVPLIVAKASTDRTASILRKIGVDKILDPEARILLSSSFKDFWEIDDNLYVVELNVREEWIGKTLIELQLRKKHMMNVVALKGKGKNWRFGNPEEQLKEDEILLVAMEKKDLRKWQ